MRTKEELAGVTALGSGHTEYKSTYDPSVLEALSSAISRITNWWKANP